MDAYELWLLRRMAHRALAEGVRRRGLLLDALKEWLEGDGRALELGDPPATPGGFRLFSRGATSRADRSPEAVLSALAGTLGAPEPEAPDWLRRIRWIVARFELTPVDEAVLILVVAVARLPEAGRLVGARRRGLWPELKVSDAEPLSLAGLLSCDEQAAVRSLAPRGPLLRQGLIEVLHDGRPRPSDLLKRLLAAEEERLDALRAEIVGEPVAADLEWDAFGHLGGKAELAERLVRAALEGRVRGTNLLFYGPPGTGKTAFAAALAARVGARLIALGEADESGQEPSRWERPGAVTSARALLAGAQGVMLLVDEADDIFASVDERSGHARQGSKAFLHRMVETMPVPTVWVTNRPAWLGAAVLRRMTLAIPFRTPPAGIRRTIVRRAAERHGFALSADDVERLAGLGGSPALVASAARAVAAMHGEVEDLVQLTDSVAALMGPRERAPGDARFDPELAQADVDLAALARKVVAAPSLALTFCLAGPPGTGKSAYARYLADRLGLEVLERRASDLLGSYVGETEQAIAAAFEEAADLRAFLILDEADSLIADRRGAVRTWEVSQVNELLVALERHAWPVAVTTNRFEALDRAALRRFVFKVAFGPMSAAQAALAFRRFFEADPPAALGRLEELTPGDFALVRRRAAALGEADPERLCAMLAAEAQARRDGARPIGFTAPVTA